MSKEEAIQAMMNGKKVTHRFFLSDEWMTMRDGMIVLEDEVICDFSEFWMWCTDVVWDSGYELFDK